jgi:hypothetical protein
MSAPPDGSKVPDANDVLRLPKPPPDFVPNRWRPTHLEFRPSGEDEQRAKTSGKPVRLTVWDETLTTVAQSRTFRAGDVVVLRVRALAVREVSLERTIPLEVVYDELDPPMLSQPGGEGHAGIEGLARPPGQPKQSWQALRQAIADRCEIVHDG